MITIMVIGIIIVFVVLLLSVITTNKAYTFKHTIDPVENPDLVEENDNVPDESKKNPIRFE